MANARNTFLLFLAWFLPNAFAGAESWTSPPPDQCPALAVMGDPSRNSFSTATPALLDSLGYRVRVVWDSPASALVVQRLLPVLLVERQHFTREQYESLRTYVRAGGGLVLIGYAANWLDADGNQRRDKTDPEITNESGSGGLAELVGASRVGGTSMIRTLQPVAGDPVSSGVEGTTWGAPDMGQGCNVVALKTTTGTVACRMVQQQFQWPKGVGDVIPGQHDLVVHRDAGSGRVVWIGWTGIISAARKDNATARRLLRNAIAWAARDIDLTTSPTGTALAESQLWQPAVGRFGSALGRKALPEVNNVETMMCHFSGRWHKVFGPPAEFAQWLADRHVEIIRVNVAACSRALYRSDVEGVSEWGASRTYRETTGRDMFADLVAELHQRGIKLCGDYNHFSNRYGDGAALRLPPAVDRDGRPSEKHYCWLSSDFAQRTRELVTELFIRYDLDALVIEDDHTPLCFCGPCIKGFKRFCEERGVVYADPRQMDPKAASPMRRLLGRYRALRYYGEIVAPMREIIHTRREGAKLGAWVGRWMREATNGYSRAGLAPFVDFEWHMAYVAPPGVADAVWSDLANISHLGTEEGAAMRPQDTADYTIQGLTAALEAGASVIGVYPEFAKTAIDPGYDGMAQVFARAEASWADRYERELASVAHVVVLGTERRLLSRQLRVLLTQRGFAVREARLDDDGRRLSELAPLIAQAHVVIAAQDVMLTDNDVVELERFVRAGGGLYLEPHALNSKPEFMGGDVVANSVPRLDADTWLKRFGVTLGDPVSVSWMSLRSVHDALRGVDTSPAVFGLCRRLTAMTSSVDAIGCDVAAGIPVLGAGSLGKGRIVCFGGVSDDALGAELLPRLCRWLSRTEEIRVTSRRVTGKRATAVFRNTGERSFTGFLGLALPRAASPVTVTCGGTMKEAVSSVTWGALRHVYVPAGIEPGRELEITVTADRLLVSD